METESKRFRIDKKFLLIVGVAAAACIIAAFTIIVTGNGQRKLNSLLNTGDRYLSELDYEQAVAAYLAAIEIGPKCEDAYLGLADTYVAMGDLAMALEILNEGYELTASKYIASRIDEISMLLTQDSSASENSIWTADGAQRDGNKTSEIGRDNDATGEQSGVTFVSWANARLEDHVMEWDDEALEQGMRETTGIAKGDIMLSDVWEITTLSLWNLGITNIVSLRELSNLTKLYLGNNQISDVSPLSPLINLTILSLAYNQISALSPLSPLINLTNLYLSGNPISDISSLSSLNNLTDLGLGQTSISDVSPLSSLNNLTWLDLYECNISDYSPLDHFAEGVVQR